MAKAKSGENDNEKTYPPTPGVTLIEPKGRYVTWRARFEDPDQKFARESARPPRRPPRKVTDGSAPKEKRKDVRKFVFESLSNPKLAGDTERARRNRYEWARQKSGELQDRRRELENGAAKLTGMLLADGFASFFEARPKLRPRTVQDYRACVAAFQGWADRAGLVTLDQITKARLLEFRDATISAPHTTAKDKTVRSDFTINRLLRGTSIVLRWLLEREKLPRCSSDDLKIGLKRVRASIDRIDFLGQGEPAALLRVALEHDRDTYRQTRDEKRGARPVGTTPRYEIVSPFVLTLLLTGCRFSECLALEWDSVKLDALGHDGKPCGEFYLQASATKTKKGREVTFDVSPSLRELFTVLKSQATNERVFGWLNRPLLEAARKRLKTRGAPSFDWQALRCTAGSYLTNSPGIYGSASAFYSARRLGHSVTVAETHYLNTVRGIPREARTLEQAMSITDEAQQVIALVRERHASQVAAE